MRNTIVIDGSHGEVRVHRATGVVVETITECLCSECAELGTYAEQIALFDVNDIAALDGAGSADILWVGFWDRDGRYEPATGHRTYWSEKWGEDYDAAVPKALLPAPRVPRTKLELQLKRAGLFR